jgi:hypothetical protein
MYRSLLTCTAIVSHTASGFVRRVYERHRELI